MKRHSVADVSRIFPASTALLHSLAIVLVAAILAVL